MRSSSEVMCVEKRDTGSLVDEKVPDNTDELVTGEPVQAAGRLVEDEQPCLVRQ